MAGTAGTVDPESPMGSVGLAFDEPLLVFERLRAASVASLEAPLPAFA